MHGGEHTSHERTFLLLRSISNVRIEFKSELAVSVSVSFRATLSKVFSLFT